MGLWKRTSRAGGQRRRIGVEIMKGERIILAGGSGFVGTHLSRELQRQGAEVVVLSRQPSCKKDGVDCLQWDGRNFGAWADGLDGSLAVINLAGRSVNCRHTARNRREIIESRVDSVRVLGQAVVRCVKPPRVFVQAAGQAIYGDFGEGCCDESCVAGEGFLVETCRLWEGEFNNLQIPGVRRALLRIGFVLGREDGAFPVLSKLTRWGLGGPAGTGRQSVNWIHATDLTNIFLSAIQRENFEGAYNACGPNPVSNAEFMRELRRALHRPWSPPAPAWAVRAGAWLMRSDGRLALTGRCCVPKRLLDQGFKFVFPDLAGAFADLCGK
jgi:uncharacterized protein (TIGR01777 family)